MIIAVYPANQRRYAAIWSQLKCFSNGFDKIVISSPHQFLEDMNEFVHVAKSSIPELKDKIIETRFFNNDRYDFGLWCDALYLKKDDGKDMLEDSAIAEYMLINDSIMAIERTDEFLLTLRERQLTLLSLNYWGQKNSTESKYWLESPLRVFSREGMKVYAQNICSLPQINWGMDCPHLNESGYGSNAQRQKRCIVELSEINVVDHYESDKIYGLYKGSTPLYRHWAEDFFYWLSLRRDGFPAVKVSHHTFFDTLKHEATVDLERCTKNFTGNWL